MLKQYSHTQLYSLEFSFGFIVLTIKQWDDNTSIDKFAKRKNKQSAIAVFQVLEKNCR